MKIIVTCGPSFEPIDEVRRITNFSTGELGVRLSNRLTQAGHEVFCLKGAAATYAGPVETTHLTPFTTNQHLMDLLVRLSRQHEIAALFHAAALCDFQVKQVENAAGEIQLSPKISSHIAQLTLTLEPAKKVISELRGLFPKSLLVGWKYELTGTTQAALAKAWRQIAENHTDACVLNGRGFGPDFGLCLLPRQVELFPDKTALINGLEAWVSRCLAAGVIRGNAVG